MKFWFLFGVKWRQKFAVVGVESVHEVREVGEEDMEPVTGLWGKLKNYYDYSMTVAGSYVETIKDLKLDEKAKWVYHTYHDLATSHQ